MPAPIAAISDWISVLATTLSIDARSTLRILPRSGRIACVFGIARVARRTAGGVALDDEQLGARRGRASRSRRACRACRRRRARSCAGSARAPAWPRCAPAAAFDALATIALAGFGCSSSQRPKCSLVARSTSERISVLPSLALVWPSNCGSASRTETIAVRPSRTSSPWNVASFAFTQVARLGVAVDRLA